jgi:invasion protein IalB
MRHASKFILVSFALIAIAAAGMMLSAEPAVSGDKAAAAVAASGPAWSKRCEKEGANAGKCEIFQRLVVKENNKRVAEFAVGFPDKKDDTARGVIVLPLGMILTEDSLLKIDDKQSFAFRPRYCTTEGCVGIVSLNKKILDVMKKAKQITFTFGSIGGKKINIAMSLDGFGDVLKQIQ